MKAVRCGFAAPANAVTVSVLSLQEKSVLVAVNVTRNSCAATI